MDSSVGHYGSNLHFSSLVASRRSPLKTINCSAPFISLLLIEEKLIESKMVLIWYYDLTNLFSL